MPQKPLPCDLHDYLEIACMYKIQVDITLKNGERHRGVPITTGIDKTLGEYLTFQPDESKITYPLSLLSIQSMQALSSNSHFDNVSFVDTTD